MIGSHATRGSRERTGEGPTSTDRVVSRAQLGSSLRDCAESSRALGARHGWRPAPDSESAEDWQAAASDPTARTLCEADVQAVTLLHSGLEHACVTGQLISAGRAFLPHTVARTTTEHLLRAQFLLDADADRPERARRRLNEWLHAIIESNHRRQGLVNTGVLETVQLDPAGLGKDKSVLLAEVSSRAEGVGEAILTTGKWAKSPRVAGTEGRPSPMRLAERYTAGGAAGIPSFTMRGHSAMTHGTEIGTLACFSDDAPADPALGDVIVPQPRPMDVPETAFCLLGVLLTTINALDEVRIRFGWPPDAKVDRRYDRAKAKAVETWSAAVNADEMTDTRP